MTDAVHIGDGAPREYADAFLRALANPRQLWDTAFRTHIPEKCRHLLFALFFCSEYGAEINDLRTTYHALHPFLCGKFGLPHDPKDFDETLRILEGGFISIQGGKVAFINPSFRDYLTEYLDDVDMLHDFAKTAKKADWARAVWRHGNRGELASELKKTLASSFLDVAQQFSRLPTWKRSPHDPNSYRPCDLSNTDRISLLMTWWQASGEVRFAVQAVAVAKNPERGFNSWRDGEDIVELVGKLRDGDYYDDFPYTTELAESLESSLISMLQIGMASDDLEKISDAIECFERSISPEIAEAAADAIVREIEEVDSVSADIDSDTTLEDHIEALEKLAPRAGVPAASLARAILTVRERIWEIREQTTVAESPSFSGSSPREPDKFDDIALRNLFAPLVER